MVSSNSTLTILTVGTGRERTDIAAALVRSVRTHDATAAVFLCSHKTRTETLPHVLEALDWPAERYAVDPADDANPPDEEDVQSLFLRWSAAWDAWVARWRPGRIVVDFTSGTKPMSAAALSLALARGADAVSYVTGDRDATGRVLASSAVRSLSPHLLLAHRDLRAAIEHFHAGSYAAAAAIARPLCTHEHLPDEHLRDIAESIFAIASAYDAWQRFDWKRAAQLLQQSQRHWDRRAADELRSKAPEMRNIPWDWIDSPAMLEDNRALIHKARDFKETRKVSGENGPALLADLIGNVECCIERGRWDDAVCRLYRATELIAQLKFRRDFDLGTKFERAAAPPPLQDWLRRRDKRTYDDQVKLGLRESYEALNALGDPLGRGFVERYGDSNERRELQNLLNSRNGSLLAHGMQPIGEEVARALLVHVRELTMLFDPTTITSWLPKARAVRFRDF